MTELKIIDGVLGNPDMAEHAYFYFRDPAYSNLDETLTEAPDPNEVEQLGFDVATERAEARRARLADLKQRIRASGFPVQENYPDPPSLGDLVLADLTALIERLFPEGSEPSPTERERTLHEAFAQNRSAVYIPRPGYFERLDEFAAASGPPLVVLGESGVGKSALLASWALRWRERHAQALFGDDLAASFVVMHFVAASPASADWAAMVGRVMAELNEHFELGLAIPEEPEALRQGLIDAIYRAAAKGRAVIVLDALNQLEDREGALDLVWLPSVIPDAIRLVVSTLPGPALDALTARSWPTIEVEPLDPAERRELIASYLYDEYRKTLAPAFSEQVANAPQSANPLFLRTMLEELRLFGDHDKLETRIGELLGAADVPALYELTLARFETDYTRGRPELVHMAMILIWAARHGLSETELLGLLGESGQPLPHGVWSPLYLAAKQMLVNHGGLLGFAHDYARAAVEHRYVLAYNAGTTAHLALAHYFETQPALSKRTLDELPWQLAQAGEWQQLCELLAKPDFTGALYDSAVYDLQGFWAEIEDHSELRMVDAYAPLLEAPGDVPLPLLDRIVRLLTYAGHPSEALALRQRLTERCRALGNQGSLQRSLGNEGSLLKARGDLDGAMALYKEQEQICRALGDQDGLQGSFGNQGLILQKRGDLDGAMALYKEQEQICRALGDQDGLRMSLGNQGLILEIRGHPDGAMALYKEQEWICRVLGDKSSLQTCLLNQGRNLQKRGDLDGAMALFKERERNARSLGDQDSLQHSLGNQGVLLETRGDLNAAMALYKEQERICRGARQPGRLTDVPRRPGKCPPETGRPRRRHDAVPGAGANLPGA